MQQLATAIKASMSGIFIQTQEEDRALAAVRHTARRELKSKNVPSGYGCLTWTVTNGIDYALDPSLKGAELEREEMLREKTADPINALTLFLEDKLKVPPFTILVMLDFHLNLKSGNPMLIRLMKEAIRHGRKTNRHIVIIGPEALKHPELEKELHVMDLPLPNKDDLMEIIDAMMSVSGLNNAEDQKEALEPIAIALSGLTASEALDALSVSLVKKKKFDAEVIKQIKTNTIKKNSVVEVVEDTVDIKRVGGLDAVKTWIKKRVNAFGPDATKYGVASPKGLLVIGISGTGKSLIGKAVSHVLRRPMLRLDGGKIFGSFVGESEKNMRAALAVAEAMSPCVLFIDELEKAIGGNEAKCDGGVSGRVLGTLLQWMQDKTAEVFVVATANDVSKLPPEMLRRGRFDQIFFVDIPAYEERVQIWDIHIRKTGRKSDAFDIGLLAKKTEGFTGAEIESIVADGILDAFTDGTEPTTETFINAIGNTVPLSSTMKEKIEKMRKWAESRAINASGRKYEPKHETKKEAAKETEKVPGDERPVLDLSV